MKLASIRAFRKGVSTYTRKGEMILVTSHGRMMGCFLPLQQTREIPIEFKKEFVLTLGERIASTLASQKITEKEILDDFGKFKKNRRRQ